MSQPRFGRLFEQAAQTLIHHVTRWRLAVALASSALIFILSSFSLQGLPGIPYLDKLVHVFVYLALGLAYFNVGSTGFRVITPKRALLSWIAAVAFGISDEWHQSFVIGRTSELADLIADAIGAGVAVWIGLRIGRWIIKRPLP